MRKRRMSFFCLSFLFLLCGVTRSDAEPAWKVRKDVAARIQSFYANYLKVMETPVKRTKLLKGNLTEEFFLTVQSGFEEMDADPILRSELIGTDYAQKIHVYNVSILDERSGSGGSGSKGPMARADVKLGELPQGAKSPGGPLRLRLQLNRIGSTWKISSIERGFDN